MPRKKKVVVEEQQEEIRLNNIDFIIKAISPELKKVKAVVKYDGITIEFTTSDGIDFTDAMEEVKLICKKFELKNYALEHNEEEVEKFILQFPDLVPYYTDEEITKLYIDAFKWLLDDTFNNEPSITKKDVLDNKSNYIRQAITMFYRFNVNKYRETLEEYLGNVEYREKWTVKFVEYLDEYLKNR